MNLHRLAFQELRDAAAFYDAQTPGLGAEFVEAVEVAFDLISRHPEAAPLVSLSTRRLVMPRFPYNIVYSLVAGEARILSIAHHSRNPSYWVGRS